MNVNPLLVPELFRCILDFIATSTSESPPGSEERRTLAVLARTCSVFSEPSLDRLWQCLDSLIPLVRCFSDVVDKNRIMTPLSPQEWLVIKRYSPRIRKLILGTERLSFHFLECTNLVLPNLEVLRWKRPLRNTLADRETVSHIRSLFTPKITTLELALGSPGDPELQSFLDDFTRLCPSLRSIQFKFRSSMPLPITPVLSETIYSRADWQRVELPYAIDNTTWKHLESISTLKAVSLALAPEMTRPDEIHFESGETPFRNVTKLDLTLWNHFEVATNLLRARDQGFHTFKVTFQGTQTTVMGVSALLASLVSPQQTQSLQSLSLTVPSSWDHSVQDEKIQGLSYTTFYPLVSLVHLRELVIDLDHPISMDDDEFANLVCHWPHLRVFWLMGMYEESAKAVTLKGLSSLLVSCRELREIGLSLDARQVPSEDACEDTDICQPFVTSLLLQDSQVHHPEPVAAFLSTRMPSLCEVSMRFRALPQSLSWKAKELQMLMNEHI